MASTLDYTVSNGYITLPVTTSASQIETNALTSIMQTLPGWVPREGHIDVLLLEQFAQMASESAVLAAQAPLTIFSYYGTLLGIVPSQGNAATAETTWTMIDSKGYTVPANTVIGYGVQGNQTLLFQNVNTFTVPVGETQATNVLIEALVPGALYNGLTPDAYPLLTQITSLAFVQSIAPTTITSGGADPENVTAYLDRLSAYLTTISPRPILAQDFATLAQSVDGVYRAVAYNNLNPFNNMLTAADSNLTSIGSWTAQSNCTVSLSSSTNFSHALIMTSAATGEFFAQSGYYGTIVGETSQGGYVAGGQTYQAIVSLDNHTSTAFSRLLVNCYDINGNNFYTFENPGVVAMPTATGDPRAAVTTFTTPAQTTALQLVVGAGGNASGQTAAFALPTLQQVYEAPTNFVTDSSILNVTTAKSWILDPTDCTATVTPIQTNINGFTVIPNDESGANGFSATANVFEITSVTAGTYSLSCYIDASQVVTATGTQPQIIITANVSGTTTPIASVTQTLGDVGIVSTTFTITSGEIAEWIELQFAIDDFTTSSSGAGVVFGMPQILLGDYVAYTPGPEWTAAGQVLNQERTVTVAACDVNGDGLSAQINENLSAYLQAQREINFVVPVIGPSVTAIDVAWTAVVSSTSSASQVLSDVNQNLTTYLSRVNWGGGNLTPPQWNPADNTVYYLSIASIIDNTAGVDHIVPGSLTIGYHGQTTLTTDDIPLLGYAPLADVGTLSGNVVGGM